jgi:predicted transcriptional regulator
MFLDGQKIPTGLDQSVADDTLMCLFDGQRRKMLKRYLETKYGMTPADYRAYWGLPDDYPMVAPGYAAEKGIAVRSDMSNPS